MTVFTFAIVVFVVVFVAIVVAVVVVVGMFIDVNVEESATEEQSETTGGRWLLPSRRFISYIKCFHYRI